MSLYKRIITAIFLILDSVLSLTSSQIPQGGIHITLIHRDSSLSPLYNPLESPYDRVRNSFIRSKARLSYLVDWGDDTNDFQGDLKADYGEYLVKFSIGTPPVEMFAVLDTASKLVMTRCMSFNNQTVPIFDYSKSLTYKNITCNSSKCNLVPNWNCVSSDSCSFVSNSLLGSDTFTFMTSNGVVCSLQDVIFGCEYDPKTTPNPPRRYDGILGLGFHDLSLILQMGSITEPKFTYCLGSNPEAENLLVLGNGVFLEGQTSSLKIIEGRYNLVLEGLSVGRKRLQIPPEIFQPGSSGGGVIIDTQTMLTFLAPDAYYHLIEELEQQIGLEMVIWPNPPYERCYNGKSSNMNEFRGVIFHFERGRNVLVDVPSLFLQVEDDLFCLAVLPSPLGGPSVLGSLFQQSYSVAYHLGKMLVSFQQIDCEVLENHLNG